MRAMRGMVRDDELPARLRCEGGELVKPNGKPIWLHGVNFGAFNHDDEQDCAPIAARGANALRVALRWWGTWGKGDEPNPDCRDDKAFAFVNRDKLNIFSGRIAAAGAAGLWSIPFIDSNCLQGGTNSPEDIAYCDPYGVWGAAGHNAYTDEGMLRMFATVVWPAMAARLRMFARVGMLEFHPEPAHHRPDSWRPRVAQVHKAILDAVRAVDPDTPVLLGSHPGYSVYQAENGLLALKDAYGGTLPGNLVWTGNLLNSYVTDSAQFDRGLRHLVDLREKHDVPVFVQQVGRNSRDDPDLSLMRHAVEGLREANVGYTWWEWKQGNPDPGGKGLNYPDEDGKWIEKEDELDVLSDAWA